MTSTPQIELLDMSSAAPHRWSETLSSDERARAARFRHARDRQRYAATRGWLREQLARREGKSATELVFRYGAEGKPSLVGSELRFNLSHCRDRAILVVAEGLDVGVDLAMWEHEGVDELARVAFTVDEWARFRRVDPAHRPRVFHAAWTVKEALVKAWGRGLSIAPDQVETFLRPSGRVWWGGRPWSWRSVLVGPGVVTSVAIEGEDPLTFLTAVRFATG